MIDLAALERLLAEATPGRWSHRSKLEDGTPCCDVIGDSDDDWSIVATGNPDLFDMRDADARLIAAAVNALPELIAAARERDAAVHGESVTVDALSRLETVYGQACAERDAARAEVERLRAVAQDQDAALSTVEALLVELRSARAEVERLRAVAVAARALVSWDWLRALPDGQIGDDARADAGHLEAALDALAALDAAKECE